MRKRFETQMVIGQRPIQDLPINTKGGKIENLVVALKAIFCNEKYNSRAFEILEDHLLRGKKKTGRNGMNLWEIFVLSQVRLCCNCTYEELVDFANNHFKIRWIMGIDTEFNINKIEYSYQNIYDNVSLVTNDMVKELNNVIIEFGHNEVFKKKEEEPLHLKTDSFVVESNVHFPTDYNLLWDSARKCLDIVEQTIGKYHYIKGWRKIINWRSELKILGRELGRACASGNKGKQKRIEEAVGPYLKKANSLVDKLKETIFSFPINDEQDLKRIYSLEYFLEMLTKHIDLVFRRIVNGEKIPHSEKIFSIFETYTEWVKKGKSRPNVELGKKLNITTDQYNLIVDFEIMDHEQDSETVLRLADRILAKYKVKVWSFDKGYWNKDNKELLQLEVSSVIMPKKGNRNKKEQKEEQSKDFKKLKKKHSAVESNINELEHRGLDRCPDRGFKNFSRYISLGVCAYNLHKIGKEINRQKANEKHKLVA